MTNLPDKFEQCKDIGSEPHSTGGEINQSQPQLLRHQVFACWQIAIISIFTGFLGGGSLIAINLYLMGQRVLAAMVLIPIAGVTLPSFFQTLKAKADPSAGLVRFWGPALLAYLLARSLFRWQYAPFRKPFAILSTPPNRPAPLWYAFLAAILSWVVILIMTFFGALTIAINMDIMGIAVPSSRNRAPNEDIPISKAPALEETEIKENESDQPQEDNLKFPK